MSFRKKYSLEYIVLSMLVLFMPFHYWICELFISSSSFDNIVRDFLIVLLLFIIYIKKDLKIRMNSVWFILIVCVLVLFAILSYLMFAYSNTFNILRTYVLPVIFGFVCAEISLSEEQIKKILRMIVIELSIIGVWGFIQAFFLGAQFIIRMGYQGENGYLSGSTSYYINGFFGYQRSVGTFVSPNALGSILAIALCIVLFGGELIKLKHRLLWLVLLGIGIMATLSRSSIFGVIFAWILVTFVIKKRKPKLKTVLLVIGTVIVGLVVISIIDRQYLGGLFSSMIQSSFLGMINQTDMSAQKHIKDLFEPISVVLKYPFGRGFGSNGPLALGTAEVAISVESSIYLMMYELGIGFGILYFIPMIMPIKNMFKKRTNFHIVCGAVSIAIGLTCILLPSTQTYETMFYTFMFCGFAINNNIEKLLRGESGV